MLTKSAYARLKVINECLANQYKKYWTMQEMLDKLAEADLPIEKRTLEADLESMRHDERLGFHAPIAYCRKNKGYYYTDPEYSTGDTPITEEHVQVLALAVNTLEHYSGDSIVEQFDEASSAVARIANLLRENKDLAGSKKIEFEKMPGYKGMENFEPLLMATFSKQPLLIVWSEYVGDGNDSEEEEEDVEVYTFHPYLLKEYKGRWYIVGHSEEWGHSITLGIDHIEIVEPADDDIPFKENTEFIPEEYFKHIIGVTIGKGTMEEIRLWFSPFQSHYIRTQHLHHTQRVVEDTQDGLIITLKLIPNYELIQLILSFGPQVEVLAPKSLRKQIAKEINEIWEMYVSESF